jgi:tetratricopeptide (TPR) repeat protein
MTNTTLASQLAQCQAAELIRRAQAEPELEYWFRHALVQEAAYESLLKSARAELHGKVAAAIEESAMDRREASAAVLALHYERAGLDAKAFPYAVMAANRARNTYAHREAVAFYDMALAMTERAGDPAMAREARMIYVHRGRVLEVAGDHPGAEANYRAMLDSARRSGDMAMQAEALNHLVTVQIVGGGLAPDLSHNLEEAATLAHQSGEPILEGRALWNMGLHNRFRDPKAAVQYLQETLGLARLADPEDVQMRELAANALIDLSVSYIVGGELRKALSSRQQAVVAYRELDNPPLLADALGGLSLILYFFGETTQSRAYAQEGAKISQATDNPWGVVYNGWAPNEMDIDAGNFEAALEKSARHLETARRVGFPVFTGVLLAQIARVHLEVGQFELATQFADQGSKELISMGTASWTSWGRGVAGGARVASGDISGARALLEPMWQPGDNPVNSIQGLIVAGPVIAAWSAADGRLNHGLAFCDWILGYTEPEGAWRFVGQMLYERGKILQRLGDSLQAEADLLRALKLLENSGARVLTWRVNAALAEVYAEAGQDDRAEAARDQAKVGIGRLADGIRDDSLRRSFLNHPEVQWGLGESPIAARGQTG